MLQPVRPVGCRHRAGQPFQYVGECGAPRPRSRPRRRTRPGSARRRWGCARTAWRSGRAPERIPASCPAPVPSTGTVQAGVPAQDAGEFVAQGVVELDDGREGLPDDVQVDAVRGGVLAGRLLDAADHGVEGLLVGGAGVEPAAHQGGDGVDAVRLDGDLAEGGDGAGELGPRGGRRARSRRTAASGRAGPPAGWCRRGWPRPGSRTASARAARWRRRCRPRSPVRSRARPCSTCSSTNAPMRASRSGSGPMASGSCPAASMACGRVTPSPSVSRCACSTVSCPAVSREPTQASPKRAPSSSPKLTMASGLGRTARPGARSSSSAAKEDTTPRGPSKAPPSGTESRCEPVTTASPAAGSPSQAHWLPLRSTS